MAFKLMPNYVSASIALSFGGLLNGYDTGCIGGVVHMSQFSDSLGSIPPSLLGLTVSSILLFGIVPALFAGQLADRHGRLRVILPGGVLFGIGALLQVTSFSLAQFIIGRAVAGVGQGVFLGNIAIYIAEIAPFNRRGRLGALPSFMSTLGVCLGYFSCYGTSYVEGSWAWRLPYIPQVALSATLALLCLVLPESPRWLLLKGRGSEARRALELLDFNMAETQRDFLNTPQEIVSLTSRRALILPLCRPYRSRTLLALFILSMIQLSGIDAITYYAPALFSQAGITASNTSLVASGVSSITMLAISIPGFMLADRWGRRTSCLVGGICLAGLMLLIGTMYAADLVKPSAGAARWVVVVCVFLFGMTYCATWNIAAKIYASEIQPGNTRAAGNSIGMASNFMTNFLVALITPILLAASAYGAYFLFGGLAIFTVSVMAVYMPETKGRSLENIQAEFQRPRFYPMTLFKRLARRRQPQESGSQRSGEGSIELSSRRVEVQISSS